MYRIVKRIVRTITTVTLLVHWEDFSKQETVEEQITLPASYSLTEEEVTDTIHLLDEVQTGHISKPILDHEGEKP